MTTTAPKYPFLVTVFRLPGSNRPVIQNYNYEDVGMAHAEMYRLAEFRDVVRVSLSVILKEVTLHQHMPRREK